MPEEKHPELGTQEHYRKEYDIVASSWRFLYGLRFSAAGFTLTVQAAFFTLYFQSFLQEGGRKLDLPSSTLALIAALPQEAVRKLAILPMIFALIGVTLTTGVLFVDRYIAFLYRTMISRGADLEFLLGIQEGHFWRLRRIERLELKGLKSAGWAIRWVYLFLYAIWPMLALYTVIQSAR